jgi:hypothetical protein
MDKYGNVKVCFTVNLPTFGNEGSAVRRMSITSGNWTKEEGSGYANKIRELNPSLDIEAWFQYPPEML